VGNEKAADIAAAQNAGVDTAAAGNENAVEDAAAEPQIAADPQIVEVENSASQTAASQIAEFHTAVATAAR